jgi:hypothetical protein
MRMLMLVSVTGGCLVMVLMFVIMGVGMFMRVLMSIWRDGGCQRRGRGRIPRAAGNPVYFHVTNEAATTIFTHIS